MLTAGSGATDIEWTASTATDVYGNWDRFGRTLKQRWFRSTTTHDQFDYTYDYAGNRLTRNIPTSLYSTDNRDQLYSYDNLQRLVDMKEGNLGGGGTITNQQLQQDYALDQLGNWSNLLDKTGGSTDLDQDRDHNAVNEITDLTTNNMGGAAGCHCWLVQQCEVGTRLALEAEKVSGTFFVPKLAI